MIFCLIFTIAGLSAGFAVLGAWLYHCGTKQQSPAMSLTMPKFGFSKAKAAPARDESTRLPAV